MRIMLVLNPCFSLIVLYVGRAWESLEHLEIHPKTFLLAHLSIQTTYQLFIILFILCVLRVKLCIAYWYQQDPKYCILSDLNHRPLVMEATPATQPLCIISRTICHDRYLVHISLFCPCKSNGPPAFQDPCHKVPASNKLSQPAIGYATKL